MEETKLGDRKKPGVIRGRHIRLFFAKVIKSKAVQNNLVASSGIIGDYDIGRWRILCIYIYIYIYIYIIILLYLSFFIAGKLKELIRGSCK